MNLLPLYHWYERNCRILPWRETTDPYRIWVSEIILQQTRVAQGLDYYMRFVARFPDIAALATAPEDEVLLYWQGLGYYSRARNLHKAARLLYQQGKSMPGTFEELRLLPGVGDYTAGAIASFAYNLPYPALDGNVYRVLARLFDSDTVFDTSQGKRFFHTLALSVLDQQNPRLCNSALMELGALQCLPGQPDCDICPLKTQCQAFEAGTVALLPVRKPRNSLQDRYLTYTIYIADSQTLIYQRQGKDIWHHLWEFPLKETDSPFAGETCSRYKDYIHVLSHRRLHARFLLRPVPSLEPFCRKLQSALPELRIVNLSDLSDYALSRLTQKAIEDLISASGLTT
ncbi:MAG: A/G-specific adenine glycosylase [Paludibacteraceae bacterium]|nr:A/G-specific adenine glycosylase [Paludibacteraceae bacterium]